MAKKEMGFVDIFSETLDIYLKNFFVLVSLSLLLFFVPAFVLTYFDLKGSALEPAVIVLSLFFIFLLLVFYLSMIFAVSKLAKKQKIDVRGAIHGGATFFWPGLAVIIMLVLFLLGLFILLIIPGVIFFVYWIFSMYAVVIENKKGMDALNYSKKLVKGKWWKTFGYVILINVIVNVVPLIIAITVADPFKNAFFSQLISAILSPITMIFMALYFFNLKSVKKINKIV